MTFAKTSSSVTSDWRGGGGRRQDFTLTNGATQVRWPIQLGCLFTAMHADATFCQDKLGPINIDLYREKLLRLPRRAQDNHSDSAICFARCVQVFLGTHLVPGVPEEAREVSARKLTPEIKPR